MDKNKDNDASNWHFSVIISIGLMALLAAIGVLTTYNSYFPHPVNSDHGSWGEFGDFVGGTLNPLFGFLGLLAILMTVSLQIRELRQSREELELTREEVAKSAKALEEQSRTLHQQRFDATFFRLLEIHAQKLMGLRHGAARGEFALKELVESVYGVPEMFLDAKPEETGRFVYKTIRSEVITKFPELMSYSRAVCAVCELIVRNKPSVDRPEFYRSIFVNELSQSELAWLFALSAFGNEYGARVKALVEQLHLLEQLNPRTLPRRFHESYESFLAPEAFKAMSEDHLPPAANAGGAN